MVTFRTPKKWMIDMARPKKLKPEQEKAILELAQQGKNYYLISKELGINHGTVNYWLRKNAVNTQVNQQ